MHSKSLGKWQHSHDFSAVHQHGEKRTLLVLSLTAVTMAVEIIAGMAFGSMALLADGWHMGTHVAAFMIAIFAYRYARKNADNPAYTFGTGKVSVLGGFASAIALAVVSLVMLIESGQRLISPQPIHFNEAIGVAVLGLGVNIACAFLLKGHHEQGHEHHHHDHNLKAAYIHVLADAFTSILAIVALVSGKYLGWYRLDAVMGLVGAVVITRWAYSLLKETSPILLDGSMGTRRLATIKERLEGLMDTRVSDIHVWRVGPVHYAAVISVVTHFPQSIAAYKEVLSGMPELAHLTIEVNRCDGPACQAMPSCTGTGGGDWAGKGEN